MAGPVSVNSGDMLPPVCLEYEFNCRTILTYCTFNIEVLKQPYQQLCEIELESQHANKFTMTMLTHCYFNLNQLSLACYYANSLRYFSLD